MNDPRFIFAGLCWIGMAIIFFAAIAEIRGKFAQEVLSKSHFKIRMFSAICWLISLGLLSYSVTVRWPVPGDNASKQAFAVYLLAGSVFLLIALLISVVDFLLFLRLRDSYKKHFVDRMEQIVREELDNKEDGEKISNQDDNIK